jgi:hypothetical protein
MIIILPIKKIVWMKVKFDTYDDTLSRYEESNDDTVCTLPGRTLEIPPDSKEINASSNDVFIIR